MGVLMSGRSCGRRHAALPIDARYVRRRQAKMARVRGLAKPRGTRLAGAAFVLLATGCGHGPLAQLDSLGITRVGHDYQVVVPRCAAGDSVSNIKLETAPATVSGSRTLWAVESQALAQSVHQFSLGQAIGGFTTTQALVGDLPSERLSVTAFGPRMAPGASSAGSAVIYAIVFFTPAQVREGSVFFAGRYGTVDDFERTACPSRN